MVLSHILPPLVCLVVLSNLPLSDCGHFVLIGIMLISPINKCFYGFTGAIICNAD